MRGDVTDASVCVDDVRGKRMFKKDDVVEIVDYPCETWCGLAMVTRVDKNYSSQGDLILIQQIPFPREAKGFGGFFEKNVRLVVDGSELNRG